MTNPDVLINIVLDRSGSMHGQRNATIEGLNAFVAEQAEAPGEARVSLTFFDTSFEARFVATPIAEFPALGSSLNPYLPSGGTALLDAVGTTIKGTEAWLANHPGFTGNVVCVIMTDGQENSSREWHIKQPTIDGDARDLAGLIKWKQTEGWQFVFLGAGGSNWLERTFGHVVDRASFAGYANTSANNTAAYAGVSHSLLATRSTGAAFVAPVVEQKADTNA